MGEGRPVFFGGRSISQFPRDMKATLQKLGHSFGNDITNGVYEHRTLEELRVEIEKIKIEYNVDTALTK